MSTIKPTGGPVFPIQPSTVNSISLSGDRGLTLRDLIAGLAMQKLVSAEHSIDVIRAMAATSYDIADAMLEARK